MNSIPRWLSLTLALALASLPVALVAEDAPTEFDGTWSVEGWIPVGKSRYIEFRGQHRLSLNEGGRYSKEGYFTLGLKNGDAVLPIGRYLFRSEVTLSDAEYCETYVSMDYDPPTSVDPVAVAAVGISLDHYQSMTEMAEEQTKGSDVLSSQCLDILSLGHDRIVFGGDPTSPFIETRTGGLPSPRPTAGR